jgi:hypothetical protein
VASRIRKLEASAFAAFDRFEQKCDLWPCMDPNSHEYVLRMGEAVLEAMEAIHVAARLMHEAVRWCQRAARLVPEFYGAEILCWRADFMQEVADGWRIPREVMPAFNWVSRTRVGRVRAAIKAARAARRERSAVFEARACS